MTLVKKTFYLSSALLLAGAMGVAQTAMSTPQDQDSSAMSQAGARIRGCLSGSDGNYTLTDNNGTIYHLVGGDAQLSGAVGHEVEISGTPDAQRSGASDTTGNTTSSFQVTGAREVGTACKNGSRTGTMGTNSQPMNERSPSTDQQPKGAPSESTPQPEPQPHMMAMLQQPGSTDTGSMGAQTGGTTSTSPSSGESQTPGNGSMANTPVTNQTPAEPANPTGTNSQLGSGTTNPSSVSTQPATGSTSTPQAGTATTPQSGATTTPETGATATSPTTGSNTANPGATTNPDMNANPAATTTSGAAATPQSNQNDQNKPLYERQATDVPWASHSGATATTSTTTNPNGSSTTTTTTTPQQQTPEPH